MQRLYLYYMQRLYLYYLQRLYLYYMQRFQGKFLISKRFEDDLMVIQC